MDKKEQAIQNFKDGYNCCQSVIKAYSDELGLDEKTLLNLSSSFGGGMGRLREVCGAVSAMFMIAGLKKGYTDPKDKEAKLKLYQLIQDMAKEFKDKNNTIICRELLQNSNVFVNTNPKPDERTKEYYQKRSCADFVGDAVDIIEDFFGGVKNA